MTNQTAETEAAEGWYTGRDELTGKDLLSVKFHWEVVWGFFCVQENQGIISATPIAATFILLNEYITCVIIENSENNEP